MIAYDFPLLGLFWTMMWFFLWVTLIMLLFRVIGDIFRSRDLGGFAKALWLIVVVVAPFLGVFIYVIARGHTMADRELDSARARQESLDASVQAAASSGASADELAKLADLRDRGVITDTEFAQQKSKILA